MGAHILSVSTLDWLIEAEGLFFYPQLALLIVTLTHTVSSFHVLSSRLTVPPRLVRKLDETDHNDPEWIAGILHDRECDLSDVLVSGLDRIRDGNSNCSVLEAVESPLEDSLIAKERRLQLLSALAHISMLTGLLGTVCGLVKTFAVISRQNVAPQPAELAAGVSQALLTTIVGLCIAIPVLLSFSYLQGKASRLLFELREQSIRILTSLQTQRPENQSGNLSQKLTESESTETSNSREDARPSSLADEAAPHAAKEPHHHREQTAPSADDTHD